MSVADDATPAAWANVNAYGIIGGANRPSLSRPVNVRLLICQACKQLPSNDGFHEVNALLRQIDAIRPGNEAPVQLRELLEICETEGGALSGGGFFTIKQDASTGTTLVKHEREGSMPLSARGSLAPGEIGSPINGGGSVSGTTTSAPSPFAAPRPYQAGSGPGPATGSASATVASAPTSASASAVSMSMSMTSPSGPNF